MNTSATLLLVEDDADLREAIAAGLKYDGWHVVDTGSAEAAVAVSAQRGHDVDIVLTDVVLPEMSGVELVQHLRARRPGLKALFMSGYSGDVLQEYGLASTDACFLVKPFSLADLEQKLCDELRKSPAEAAAVVDRGNGHTP